MRHDHILCYVKGGDKKATISQLPMDEKALSNYKNIDNDPNGLWKSDPATAQAGHGTKSQFYTLIAPNGKKHELPSGRCWLYTEEVFMKLIQENKIWFGKDGNGVPRIKTYLYAKERALTPESIIFASNASTNEGAKNSLKDIFNGKSHFETPKPVELLQHLLQLSTSKNDIILDSFAGSGTTAHAVLEQNKQDGGNRKFILIETMDYAKDITAERVKRVIDGYSFTGKDKTTLYEKKLTITDILNPKKMESLSDKASKTIEENKDTFDKIKKLSLKIF
jgi:adenine-specific DNA-methyltransferase